MVGTQREGEVGVRWLDWFVSMEAGASFLLASLSCLHLVAFARAARTAARRLGAAALATACGAMALEALLFLSQSPLDASFARSAALVLVRSFLLFSASLLALLIWRNLRLGS